MTAEADPDRVVVLVVDDDPHARLVMEDFVNGADRDVVFAESGREALRSLRRVTPAVVLLDVELGDMSGFDLAKLIRDNQRLAEVPIVFVTGHATDDDAMFAGYDLGAVDYLRKPVVPAILMSKVNALCTLALQVKQIERQRDELRRAQAQLANANDQLELLAATDPLTGLLNRRQLLVGFEAMLDHQRRNERNHLLVVMDLNGFKAVNDQHGHAAGDVVLCQAADRLRGQCRTYDLAARLGGDEFCLVFNEVADLEDAEAIATRIWTAMAEKYGLPDGAEVDTPASIGVLLITPEEQRQVDLLLSRADNAMYLAKRKGIRSVVTGPERTEA